MAANMIRKTIFIIILLGGYLSSPVFAIGKGPAFRFLKEPAVKWNAERLTGEVNNAPVKNLITELLRMEGSNWEMIGNLEGSISISFDNLTINDSIKKIMRLHRFNYALIFDEQRPPESEKSHLIRELTIYQGDQRIRFSRTQKQTSTPKKEKFKKAPNPGKPKTVAALPAKPSTVALPAPPPAKKPKIRNTRQSGHTGEDIADIGKEMRAFADEMLAEKKMKKSE